MPVQTITSTSRVDLQRNVAAFRAAGWRVKEQWAEGSGTVIRGGREVTVRFSRGNQGEVQSAVESGRNLRITYRAELTRPTPGPPVKPVIGPPQPTPGPPMVGGKPVKSVYKVEAPTTQPRVPVSEQVRGMSINELGAAAVKGGTLGYWARIELRARMEASPVEPSAGLPGITAAPAPRETAIVKVPTRTMEFPEMEQIATATEPRKVSVFEQQRRFAESGRLFVEEELSRINVGVAERTFGPEQAELLTMAQKKTFGGVTELALSFPQSVVIGGFEMLSGSGREIRMEIEREMQRSQPILFDPETFKIGATEYLTSPEFQSEVLAAGATAYLLGPAPIKAARFVKGKVSPPKVAVGVSETELAILRKEMPEQRLTRGERAATYEAKITTDVLKEPGALRLVEAVKKQGPRFLEIEFRTPGETVKYFKQQRPILTKPSGIRQVTPGEVEGFGIVKLKTAARELTGAEYLARETQQRILVPIAKPKPPKALTKKEPLITEEVIQRLGEKAEIERFGEEAAKAKRLERIQQDIARQGPYAMPSEAIMRTLLESQRRTEAMPGKGQLLEVVKKPKKGKKKTDVQEDRISPEKLEKGYEPVEILLEEEAIPTVLPPGFVVPTVGIEAVRAEQQGRLQRQVQPLKRGTALTQEFYRKQPLIEKQIVTEKLGREITPRFGTATIPIEKTFQIQRLDTKPMEDQVSITETATEQIREVPMRPRRRPRGLFPPFLLFPEKKKRRKRKKGEPVITGAEFIKPLAPPRSLVFGLFGTRKRKKKSKR